MGGLRLGRIFGLEIRIDPSWLIIFFLVLWSFTAGVFPQRYPGLPAPVYVAMGSVGTVLFFVSVLLHEMAHSVVARAKGIPVEGITLFVFGGVAHAGSEFETPRDEFLIAAAGPLSSFLIAGGFTGIALVGGNLGWSVAITGVASYLGLLNFVLAVFNLLPGFPLDGGRLLRAAVWKYTGDMTRATRIAAAGGKALGYLLMGLGFAELVTGVFIGGLWMMFIGWFVRMTAASSYAQQLLRDRLVGLTAADAVDGWVLITPPDVTLRDFAEQYWLRGDRQWYIVVEDGRPTGMISFRLLRKVPLDRWTTTTVGEAMSPIDEAGVVAGTTPMIEVLDRIQKPGVRHVLVVEDGRLIGVLSAADIARWLERVQMM